VTYTKEQKKTLAAYKDVFTSPNGKLVLEDLRLNNGDRQSYVKGDPYHTAFNEGRRAIYLDILALIEQATKLERNYAGRDSRPTITSDADDSASDDTDGAGAE
jgi:hypothetical protein